LQLYDILPRLVREGRSRHVVVYVDISHLEKGFMSAGASYALPVAYAGEKSSCGTPVHLDLVPKFIGNQLVSPEEQTTTLSILSIKTTRVADELSLGAI
jgi:hypothetical protein